MLKIMIGVEENILYFRLLSHLKYYAYGGGGGARLIKIFLGRPPPNFISFALFD